MNGKEIEVRGKELVVPEDWAQIPLQDYLDKGFHPYIKTVGERKYITLKKGRQEKSLGPHTEERWELLTSIFPHKTSFPPIEEMTPIDDRIRELKEKDLSRKEIVTIMHGEGYPTAEMMKRGLPIRALEKREREASDRSVMGAIEGSVRGEGYLYEFKNMIRAQISRSRELTQKCFNIGLGTILAALSKSAISMDDFRRIAQEEGPLNEALTKAGETAFKALEYYQSDLVTEVEAERDEARAYASVMEAKVEDLLKGLDPKMRLEKMIQVYMLSGSVEPDTLIPLIDKWLGMEITEVKKEALLA